MTKLNLDRDFYTILGEFKNGLAFVETDGSIDSVAGVISELREYENAHTVFWFNPAEGKSRDVSEDMAREWFETLDVWFTGREPDPAIPQFIVNNLPDLDQRLRELYREAS